MRQISGAVAPAKAHTGLGKTAVQIAAMRALAVRSGFSPADPMRQPLNEARQQALAYHTFLNKTLPKIASVEDLMISISNHAPTRVRQYRPIIKSSEPLPVIIYIHGGGFVVNTVDSYERALRLIAIRTESLVVAIDYAKAPEFVFPYQHHEILRAIGWIAGKADQLGIDVDRMAVAGDSAGAALAFNAVAAVRDGACPRLLGGLLFYGMFVRDFDTASHRAFGDGRDGLSTERMRWFWTQYLSSDADPTDPRAQPLKASVDGLAPLILVAAGRDCLRDDTLRLADRLRRSGQPYSLHLHRSLPHSFVQMTAHVDLARRAVNAAAHELSAILRGGWVGPQREGGADNALTLRLGDD